MLSEAQAREVNESIMISYMYVGVHLHLQINIHITLRGGSRSSLKKQTLLTLKYYLRKINEITKILT